MEMRKLGRSGILVPALGVGTAAWGFPMMGYGKTYHRGDLFSAYQYLLDSGFNFFDTSEGYANGESERLLGEFHQQDGREIMIASKFDPTQDPQDLLKSVDGSLRRLGVEKIDLLQMHYPPKKGTTIEQYIDVMAETVKCGKALALGVSNFNLELMERACQRLEFHHLPLASNEVYYNLLERRAENNGVLTLCRSQEITLIPFSPMAQGLLTGKFRKNRAKVSFTQKMYLKMQDFDVFHEGVEAKSFIARLFHTPKANNPGKLEPLFETLEQIAVVHGATIPQVVLNWLLATDEHILPIPGVKNQKQAKDNIATLSFRLTVEEYQKICRVDDQID